MFPAAAQVKSLTNPSGLYLHIPFCEKKCKYCNFYSSFVTEELLDSYTNALIKSINQWGGEYNRPIDTIYFGGGTPSLLGHRLPIVLNSIRTSFDISKNSEITLEINPASNSTALLEYAKEAGFNRLSIGAQSGSDRELEILGRTHTAADTEKTVNSARKMGFSNISLDIMIGLPFSNRESLKTNLEFISGLSPEHISAYILKIEEKTAFFKERHNLSLPDDDDASEQYLAMADFFENKGYSHYEISNFSKAGYESRHNLKYWNGTDYLGIGPSAHSSLNGKRFYYKNDLKEFISGNNPIDDGESGGEEEFIMLRLRLKSGIDTREYQNLFGKELSKDFLDKCRIFQKAGFLNLSDKNICLTNKGMLLSNSIITELLECQI